MSQASPRSLPEFLAVHPWPQEWSALGKPLDYLWILELEVEREALWAFVSDTSAFNKRLGLSEMTFTERAGRVYGTAVNAGMRQSWEEVPWEWDYATSLSSVRLYSEGLAHVVRARYLLEDAGPGRTRLSVYFGWIPRGTPSRAVLRLGMRGLEKDYRRVLQQFVEARAARVRLPEPEVEPLGAEAQQSLAGARSALEAAGIAPALVQRLAELVERSPEAELVALRPRVLAREWKVPERELLLAFLQATRAGLLTLTWDVVCPHCRSARASLAHLGEVPKRGECEVCGVEIDPSALNALEVTFHVHLAIRRVEARLFCSAEPARKPHIHLQRLLQPGEVLRAPSLLGPGRYRLRVRAATHFTLLDLDPDEAAREVSFRSGEAGGQLRAGPRPELVLQNTGAEPSTFVLESCAEDRDQLRPVDLFSCQGFHDLFSQEAMRSDLQLDIGTQTILFTDLVGSTRFYEAEGDTVAFAEVRRHFIKAYQEVAACEGAIVKTIGDAVMAAFSSPVNALRAAHQLQLHFSDRTPENRLRLRITLHSGPCLAVNLNQSIDYFGSTVNLAAKLQSLAEAGQIAFTEVVARDPAVAAYLAQAGLAVEPLSFLQKWSGGTIPAFRVAVG